MATQSAAVAAFFAASGEEVLPIGGFTGTIPSPTPSQLQAGIRAGQFHLVLATSAADPRIAWIAAHCQDVTKPGDALKSYLCLPASAGAERPSSSPAQRLTVIQVAAAVPVPGCSAAGQAGFRGVTLV
jgi:hypothetical protein